MAIDREIAQEIKAHFKKHVHLQQPTYGSKTDSVCVGIDGMNTMISKASSDYASGLPTPAEFAKVFFEQILSPYRNTGPLLLLCIVFDVSSLVPPAKGTIQAKRNEEMKESFKARVNAVVAGSVLDEDHGEGIPVNSESKSTGLSPLQQRHDKSFAFRSTFDPLPYARNRELRVVLFKLLWDYFVRHHHELFPKNNTPFGVWFRWEEHKLHTMTRDPISGEIAVKVEEACGSGFGEGELELLRFLHFTQRNILPIFQLSGKTGKLIVIIHNNDSDMTPLTILACLAMAHRQRPTIRTPEGQPAQLQVYLEETYHPHFRSQPLFTDVTQIASETTENLMARIMTAIALRDTDYTRRSDFMEGIGASFVFEACLKCKFLDSYGLYPSDQEPGVTPLYEICQIEGRLGTLVDHVKSVAHAIKRKNPESVSSLITKRPFSEVFISPTHIKSTPDSVTPIQESQDIINSALEGGSSRVTKPKLSDFALEHKHKSIPSLLTPELKAKLPKNTIQATLSETLQFSSAVSAQNEDEKQFSRNARVVSPFGVASFQEFVYYWTRLDFEDADPKYNPVTKAQEEEEEDVSTKPEKAPVSIPPRPSIPKKTKPRSNP